MPHGILLFDGVCNLCNRLVNFIIDHDRTDYFRFVSLQSEKGKQILAENGHDPNVTDSIVFIENGKLLLRSDAVLAASKHLTFPYWLGQYFYWLPRGFRNFVYNQIAKRRYQWFGKLDVCRVPTPQWQSKFL